MNRLEIQKDDYTLIYDSKKFFVTSHNFYYQSHKGLEENMFDFDNDVSDSEEIKIRFEVLALVEKAREFVKEVF